MSGQPLTDREVDELIQAALKAHRDSWDSDDEDLSAIVTIHDLWRNTRLSPDIDIPAADRAVDAGLGYLESEHRVDRIFGIRLIREMHRDDEVAAALLHRLRHENDPAVIDWCINGLNSRATSEALPDLVEYIGHPDAELRYTLAGAISSCAFPTMSDQARALLLTLADDEDADVRFSALFELSSWWQHENLRDALVEQRLRAGLSDPDEGVQRTCAEALEPDAS